MVLCLLSMVMRLDRKPVPAIEVKHPGIYNPKTRLKLHWKKGEKASKSPLKQIYGYMLALGHRYGVLTTYQQTWFLKRDVYEEAKRGKVVKKVDYMFRMHFSLIRLNQKCCF